MNMRSAITKEFSAMGGFVDESVEFMTGAGPEDLARFCGDTHAHVENLIAPPRPTTTLGGFEVFEDR